MTELVFSTYISLVPVKSVEFTALEMDILSSVSRCCFKNSTIKKILGSQMAPVLAWMDKPVVKEDI